MSGWVIMIDYLSYECIDHFNSEDLNYLDFYYGYYNFDTIYDSFLSGYMYLNATGWSPTVFYFWKAVTPPATAIYFIFMLFILYLKIIIVDIIHYRIYYWLLYTNHFL